MRRKPTHEGAQMSWMLKEETRRQAMPTKGRFERSEDSQTWEEVDREVMRRRLSGAYHDVDLVIRAMMQDGQPVRTPFAFYRFAR
jgi:hypothetical protein